MDIRWVLTRRPVAAVLCAIVGCAAAHGVMPGGNGGHLDFRAYPMPSGAPVAAVNGIAEGADGAIWVATWGEGLHRIFRTEWQTYTESDGLPDDWVRSVWVSPAGDVWVATGDGIGIIRDGLTHRIRPAHFPDGVDGDVALVRVLSTGWIWAVTWSGWVLRRAPLPEGRIDVETPWEIVADPEGTRNSYLDELVEVSPDEVLGTGHRGGLFHYFNGQWQAIETPEPAGHYTLYTTEHTGRVEIWVIGHGPSRLYRFDGGQWIASDRMPELGYGAVAFDAAGTGFAATPEGLKVCLDGSWMPVNFPQDLGVPQLDVVCVASDGAVWLGGKEGLIRGARRSWSRQPNAEGVIAFVARTGEGNPVLGLDVSGGVYTLDDGHWNFRFTIPSWPPSPSERVDSNWLGDGQVWRAPGGGLHWLMLQDGALHHVQETLYTRIDTADGAVLAEQPIPPVSEYRGRFLLTKGGDLLALTESGVWQLEGKDWAAFPAAADYQQKRAHVVLETAPDTFWAGVRPGLERWDSQGVRFYGDAEGVREEDTIHAIAMDERGLWIGTSGSGVYVYDGEGFAQFDKSTGLHSNLIRNVYVARDGLVWVAYRGSGVSAFRSGRWIHHFAPEGLPNEYIVAFAEPTPGDLWTVSRSGALYRYTPDVLPPETQLEVGPPVIASHGVGVFSFTGWDAWNQTERLRFSWRTVLLNQGEEVASDWSRYAFETTVSPPALSPGQYRFEVRSSDENGNADPSPASMLFVVALPFWQKPVFYLPVLLSLLTALIMYVIRLQSHRALARSERALRLEVSVRQQAEAQLEAQQELLEATVEARTEELKAAQEALIQKERLATLGQLTATVSHELRNPLGTIQSSLYTIEKRVHGAGLNLERVIERTVRSIRRCNGIIEEMLDYTRSQKVSLRRVPLDDWLRVTTGEMTVPEDVEFTRTFQSGVVISIDTELIRRVLVNLVDNSIQAMEIQTTGKRIEMTAHAEPGAIRLTVEDTGPGIPEEVLAHIFEPLFSTKNFGVGLGTNIVKNIVDRHGGTTVYGNKPEGGARVEITLPCEEQSQP